MKSIGGGYGRRMFEAAKASGDSWQPPSDEERRLFMEHADHRRRLRDGENCGGFCHWLISDWHIDGAPIADSLALDGADYDQMPPGFEWHPPERSKR